MMVDVVAPMGMVVVLLTCIGELAAVFGAGSAGTVPLELCQLPLALAG